MLENGIYSIQNTWQKLSFVYNRRMNTHPRQVYFKKCMICNRDFSYIQYVSVEKIIQRKTCSRDCMYKLISLINANNFVPNSRHEKNPEKWTKTACGFCGKEISHHKSAPRVFCSIQCKNNHQRTLVGDKNPNWKPYDEKKLYKSQNKIVRRELIRERVFCERCGTQKRLQVHHINRDYYNNSTNNLMLLCVFCHADWHEERGDINTAKLIRAHYQATGKRTPKQAVVCKTCGTTFYPSNKNRFCSKRCASLYRYPNQHKKIVCRKCGITFERKRTKQVYCSEKCRNERCKLPLVN